jgi:hypothetical protein
MLLTKFLQLRSLSSAMTIPSIWGAVLALHLLWPLRGSFHFALVSLKLAFQLHFSYRLPKRLTLAQNLALADTLFTTGSFARLSMRSVTTLLLDYLVLDILFHQFWVTQ